MTVKRPRKDAYIPALIYVDAKGRKRTVYMGDFNDSEREAFFRSLLTPYTPEKIRRVIMQQLGISHREQRREREHTYSLSLWLSIETRKAEMQRNGERPRAGIHNAAVEEIASEHGMAVGALEKRFQRHLGWLTGSARRDLRQDILHDPIIAKMVQVTHLQAKFRRLIHGAGGR